MPYLELLQHLRNREDEIVTGDPRSMHLGAKVETRKGDTYVASFEGAEMRGNAWVPKVRWNRV